MTDKPFDSTPDWSAIDTLLLDMDGTVLDLHFDNHFWSVHLPSHLAARHEVPVERVIADLEPHFRSTRATLSFYCLDFWSDLTDTDIPELKRELVHLIDWRRDARAFLDWSRNTPMRVIIATNAHAGSWQLKDECTGIVARVDGLVSAHDYGVPKEDAAFWERLFADHEIDPARTMFIDDNLDVLASARRAGIRQLLSVSTPDSRRPRRELDEPAIDLFGEISPLMRGRS